MEKDEKENWLPVVAKALAVLALHQSELGTSDISVKAEFLEGLGIPRAEAAQMLGTSSESLRVMMARKKKRGGRSGKQKRQPKKA